MTKVVLSMQLDRTALWKVRNGQRIEIKKEFEIDLSKHSQKLVAKITNSSAMSALIEGGKNDENPNSLHALGIPTWHD